MESFSYSFNGVDLEARPSRDYHNICPVATYLKDDKCYSRPINEAILALY